MSSATVLVLLLFSAIVIMAGLYIYYTYKPGKDNTRLPASAFGQGTMIIDFIHGWVARVVEIRFRDDRDDVVLDNGRIFPYEKNLLKLLNTSQVMAGKPATFTYGITDNMSNDEIVKKYGVMRNDYLNEKARANEVRLREQKLVKEVVNKTSGKVADK